MAQTKIIPENKRHYNTKSVLKDYLETYGFAMKLTAISIGGVLLYFIFLIVYLGAFSHTPHKDKYDTYKDRFIIEYEGQKLPYYQE